MLAKFYPYEYIDSVFDIDYKKLYELGYRGIIFDIDNTLVYHGEGSNEKVDNLFVEIQKLGFKTLLLSNNSEERILDFLKNINSKYIADAQKPLRKNYLKALKMLNLNKNEVVMVGDQIFTDIFGANRVGIASILVKFLRKPEEKYFGKRRELEFIVLKHYNRNKKMKSRIFNKFDKL